jgi:hypothetical protein
VKTPWDAADARKRFQKGAQTARNPACGSPASKVLPPT